MRLTLTTLMLVLPTFAQAQSKFGFEVQIYLSEKASKELAFTGQNIRVWADFYGNPRKGFASKADKMGRIDLGEEEIDTARSVGIVYVTGKNISLSKLKMISGKLKVNLNIFSILRGSPNNILDCDIIDGDIPTAADGPQSLHCKLIGEN